MANPPAFQMYAADFLVDTSDWTVDEIGIYLRLLLNEWVNGKLPNEHKRLARIAGVSLQKFQKRWRNIEQKFVINGDGFLYNRRLEEEREKQVLWREKSKLGGIKSGENRRRVVEPPNEPNHEPNANSSSSSSSSCTKVHILAHLDSFEIFWKSYPKKKSKGQAKKAWMKLKPGKQLLEKIISTIERAKTSEDWLKEKGKYIPYPATWLNAEGWNDEFGEVRTGHLCKICQTAPSTWMNYCLPCAEKEGLR
jgi:uncharacterized protein YdaU (DUF1376 family)